MSPRSRTALIAFLLTATASTSWAQRRAATPPGVDDWQHGTTLAASVGVASDSADTGTALGGSIGWELKPQLSLEGSGLWVDRSYGSGGFNAAMKLRAGVRHGAVAPFIEGGVGLYHINVTAGQPMPEFYQRRLDANSGSLSQSFTDPTFHIGAGVTIFTSRHIALQPAVEAIIVTRDSHAYTLTSVALRLAYHFEDHPVTR